MLNYRKPLSEDCRMVYEWICDPLTRASSFGPPPASYAAHEAWYMNRITAKSGAYLIFYPDDTPENPAGQVRVDDRDEGLVVSILTAPAHRGKGYASEMLQILVSLYGQGLFGKRPLRAWIMNQNAASRRAFEAAGFRFESSTDIAGIPSNLYIYN
ncbi:MAG: GNAT family N-acetyltransferase [Bacteroidota bacterium]